MEQQSQSEKCHILTCVTLVMVNDLRFSARTFVERQLTPTMRGCHRALKGWCC